LHCLRKTDEVRILRAAQWQRDHVRRLIDRNRRRWHYIDPNLVRRQPSSGEGRCGGDEDIACTEMVFVGEDTYTAVLGYWSRQSGTPERGRHFSSPYHHKAISHLRADY
jgi:hypothetical protein